MIRLDHVLLEELGLGHLPDPRKQIVLRTIYDELEMRVGMALAERMSDQQMDDLSALIDAADEAGAYEWLTANFPDNATVVRVKFEELCAEIALLAGDVNALLDTLPAQERF